jgi:hypothetical protein
MLGHEALMRGTQRGDAMNEIELTGCDTRAELAPGLALKRIICECRKSCHRRPTLSCTSAQTISQPPHRPSNMLIVYGGEVTTLDQSGAQHGISIPDVGDQMRIGDFGEGTR